MNTRVSKNEVWIQDSYLISKKEFKAVLEKIKKKCPNSDVWIRSLKSLKREWAVHNFLYRLNIQRDRTQSVNFEYPIARKYRIGYEILGRIFMIFIK